MKKLVVILSLFAISMVGYSEPLSSGKTIEDVVNEVTKNGGTVNDVMNEVSKNGGDLSNISEAVSLYNKGKNATNNNVAATPKVEYNQFAPDLTKTLESVEDLWNVIDGAENMVFSTLDSTGTAVSSTLATIGSLPTIFGNGAPGAASAANTIQTMLLKLNQVKQRVDQLKQYRRVIENLKGLSKADLTTINGINKTLYGVSNLLTEGASLKDNTMNFLELAKKTDLSTLEGWDNLISGDNNLNEAHKEAIDNIAGDKKKEIDEAIKKVRENIKGINANTEKGELEKMNANLDLLISLLERQIANDSTMGAVALAKSNKELEEKIAREEAQKKQQENVLSYKEELAKQTEKLKNKLASSYQGDVTGGRGK